VFGRAPRALLLGRSWSWSQKAGAPKRGSAYAHLKQLRLLCSTPGSAFACINVWYGSSGGFAEGAGATEPERSP